MAAPHYVSLYQINTRVWLTELVQRLGRPATLDDIPDTELDRLAGLGFDWIWLLSVWRTGRAGQQVSRSNPNWRREFQETLPDLREEDIAGSGFAITGYVVHENLGGDAALARLRARMQQRRLRLMLDFVPNHTALDHSWTIDHPEYYIQGTDSDLSRSPQNYIKIKRTTGDLILAHGRDPYFPGWPDTLQLNYANPAVQEAMSGELLKIAGQCDGVRCDMAMLILPDVFERTWGLHAQPFWPTTIARVLAKNAAFRFMAEVYWDLEWTLQQQGFDFTYDKRLYDRLRDGQARPLREHFLAGLDYQDKLARFLENHDEPRAAAAFSPESYQAAAVLAFLSPGLRFFHQGQFEGRKKRISPHLVRAPGETPDPALQAFYEKLLAVVKRPLVREGTWRLLECVLAWEGNGSWDDFLAFGWQGADGQRLVIAVNYAPQQSQCFVHIPWEDLAGMTLRLQDIFHEVRYDRDGQDLLARGLFLDIPAWAFHVFDLTALS